MLEAIFYSRVITTESNTLAIDDSSLTPGFSFQIESYSQSGGYTLVQWALGDGEESIAGETLWSGTTPILTGGGELNLFSKRTPDSKRRTAIFNNTIWEQYAQSDYAVPDSVGRELRKNTIFI